MTDLENRLKAVEWASLNHCYGQATDVPQMILDLFSGDDALVSDAAYTIEASMCHQAIAISSVLKFVLPYMLEVLKQRIIPESCLESYFDVMESITCVLFRSKDSYYHSGLYQELREVLRAHIDLFEPYSAHSNRGVQDFAVLMLEQIETFSYDAEFRHEKVDFPFAVDPTMDELENAMKNSSFLVRVRVAYELGLQKSRVFQAYRLLVMLLMDEDRSVRKAAVSAFRKLAFNK